MQTDKMIPPIHPGEILKEEFLLPNGLTANQLALHLQVPPGRITGIINGQRGITADTAIRLSKFFQNSAEFWMNLQSFYDLKLVEQTSEEKIRGQVRPFKADR